MGVAHRIARDAPVIAPIGVALALVRDVVERTIVSPSPQEIARIRREAADRVIAAGAAPERVVVEIEIDTQRNRVCATASGATALVEAAAGDACSESDRVAIAAQSFACNAAELHVIDLTSALSGYERRRDLRVIDERGVVRLALRDYRLTRTTAGRVESQVRDTVETATQFGDVGRALPALYLLRGARIAAYEGLTSTDQAVALAAEEVEGCAPDESIVILIEPRSA
jgi:hypothetical protein